MSEIDYQALRERYSPKPVPECSVCGEEMSIQRISGAHVVYACSGEGDDGYFKIGRTFADEHYEKSRVTVVDDSDPDVIALLDELEAAKSILNEQREYYEGVISDGSKRIAELEKSEEQLINERDHAESALADMYFAATGDRPEWSNCFSFSDAVDAVVDRIADLEAKQPSPVVPEEKPMPNPLSRYAVDAVAAIAEVRGWNACRAAMLQGSQPVSQTYKLNELAGNSPVTPGGWISCSERMPDNNHDVLFFDVWGYIRIGWFSADDRSWFTSDDGCCMEVTHWMPLPEPPQEVNRG